MRNPESDTIAPIWLGPWRVEPVAGRLVRDGADGRETTVRRLEPKAVQVLMALIARAGKVVDKDTLLDEVWEGRHVSPDVLTGAISAIRARGAGSR